MKVSKLMQVLAFVLKAEKSIRSYKRGWTIYIPIFLKLKWAKKTIKLCKCRNSKSNRLLNLHTPLTCQCTMRLELTIIRLLMRIRKSLCKLTSNRNRSVSNKIVQLRRQLHRRRLQDLALSTRRRNSNIEKRLRISYSMSSSKTTNLPNQASWQIC